MKLVEILAKELDAWPDAEFVMQDRDKWVAGYSSLSTFDGVSWSGESYADMVDPGFFKDLASDHHKAIVTRADWEKEKMKQAAPKNNAEGWIRHRGGKQPVEDGAVVEVRDRAGDIYRATGAELRWTHGVSCGDIMAYRLHKPAEQVASDQVMRDCVEKCASTESAGELLYDPIAQGPLQWRDRITELDEERKTIDALYQVNTARIETERAELVQKLAGEGFALIGRINELLTEAAQKHEDVGDPKNWKVGDELKAIGNCGGFSFAGEVVKILVVRDDGGFEVATESDPDYGWFFTEEESITDLRFHSRPSV